MGENDENTVFLTREEVLEAIGLDLEQYPPQPILLRRLAQLILGEEGLICEERGNRGLWVKSSGEKKARLATYGQLPPLLLSELKNRGHPLKTFAAICASVFQEKAYVCRRESDGLEGVILETGAENFQCRQCGRCCLFLDYQKELTHEDCRLWEKMGRADILKKVGMVRRGDEIVAYRIWIDPGTNRLLDRCPWLKKDSEHNKYFCLIHDVRPRICRQYPGTRKHARMTGCPGFRSGIRIP